MKDTGGAPERPEASGRGQLLVVDDDPAVRRSLCALLEEDFEVAVAEDVTAAERLLSDHPFDVLLSDYEMPGESGMAFLRRTNQRYPGMMGILVTGHQDHPEVRAAEKDQAIVRVITKPYDPARLIKWVDNAVKLARMRQAMAALERRTRRG